MRARSRSPHGQTLAQLSGTHKWAADALSQESSQGCAIGLGIGVLLPKEIEALLQHGTHGGTAAAVHQGFREGVLVIAQGDRALDRHDTIQLTEQL
jgi:hypothetical protein